MLAAGYATYQVLNGEMDLSPICMAGHSLGEYTALVAAEVSLTTEKLSAKSDNIPND
jgi:malonyl CoA-acyl carrier protein transacylase